jgi:hypothetical protein
LFLLCQVTIAVSDRSKKVKSESKVDNGSSKKRKTTTGTVESSRKSKNARGESDEDVTTLASVSATDQVTHYDDAEDDDPIADSVE